ncbi:MAG: FG-GAP repeat protein, partial [Deltaproteobacteria bacterium]|nr:FG-GAP repeat protein [Deltaproteobacteria bacterium]
PYTVVIEATEVIDPAGIWLVVVSNGVPGQAMNPTSWIPATGTASFDVTFSNGNTVLQVTATNSCGTTNESLAILVGPVDAPTIVITTPTTGSCSEAASIHVEASTTNVAQGVTCYFCMRETTAGQVPECTSALSAASGQVDASGVCQVDLILPFEADWQIWGSVTNTVPITSTSPAVEVKYDDTDPVVAFVQPTDPTVFNAASVDTSPGVPGFQTQVVISHDETGPVTVNFTGHDGIISGPDHTPGTITFPAVTLNDGVLLLEVEVCDCANNCATAAPVNVTVDRVAPDVIISVPIDNDKLGETDDDSLIAGFQYDVVAEFTNAQVGDTVVLSHCDTDCGNQANWIDEADLVLNASQLNTYLFDDVTLTVQDIATIQILATITDAAGNADDSGIITVFFNRNSPTVDITRPPENAELNFMDDFCDPDFQSQVNIETHNTEIGDLLVLCICHGACPAADPGSADRCAQNGYGEEVWVGTVTGTTTYVMCVPMEQGENRLRAFARNDFGQESFSDEIIVYVDSTFPTVVTQTITSDLNGDSCLNASEGDLTVSFTVSDTGLGSNLDGRLVTLVRDWPTGSAVAGCNNTILSDQVIITCSLADDVLPYALTATFLDTYNNPNIREANPVVADAEAQFAIRVDTQAPAISVTDPDPTPVNSFNHDDDLNGGTQAADFNFCVSTDAEEGQTVTFYIDGSPEGTTADVLANGTACIQTTMGQGSHALTAMVEDSCGNQTTSAALNIDVDTIVPTITCSAPTTGDTETTQNVPFTCDITEAGEISVDSDLGDNCLHAAGSAGNTDFICQLGEGTHNLSITVTDQAGNVSDPYLIDNVTVSVDGCQIAFNDPTPTVLNAADDDGNPDNGISIDLTACSNDCNSSCALCSVTIWVDDTQQGGAQPFDAGGCVDFNGVVLPHKDDDDTVVRVEVDDGQDVTFDQFSVLVDLRAPVIELLVPSGPAADCVVADNPRVDGLTVIADEDPGAPFDCDMDFQIRVTDGGNGSNGGTITLEDGAPISTDNVDASPDDVVLANVALAHDDSHALTVRVVDAAGNQATAPVTITADVVAPGAADMSSSSVTDSRRAYVSAMWAATGDDGSVGAAAAYNLKWSLSDIDGTNWDAANLIYSGSNQSWPGASAPALQTLNTYHLAVRAEDELGNLGPVSADHSLANNWNELTYTSPSGGYFSFFMQNLGDIDSDNDDDLAVSAPTQTNDQGALYVFYGEDPLSSWASGSPQQINRGINGEFFGYSFSGKGDLDRDTGSPANNALDLVVGGRGFDSNRGRVSIYFGVVGGQLPGTPAIEIRPAETTATEFGGSVKIIGDVNGDGQDDLFVGAPMGGVNGQGYIFFGRTQAEWTDSGYADGLDADNIPYIPASKADVIILGEAANDEFGFRHGSTGLGDLDGDGNDEYSIVASKVFKVYNFDGASHATTTSTADAVNYLTESSANDANRVGFGMNSIGGLDFTGDSYPDLVVTDASSPNSSLYLYACETSPEQISTSYTKKILNGGIGFGFDLEAGDINLDGELDLLVGSYYGDSAFLHLNTGQSPYFSDTADSTLLGAEGFYGISVALGDFDGDGRLDIALGSLDDIIHVLY